MRPADPADLKTSENMEVVITSLDALIHKATNASLDRPDPAALEAFCAVLGDSPNGAYIATRVIASRIRSRHPTEALLALDVLDACMKRCDVSFHAEVDKFRFLNEMIKLVSPKYYGNKTAPAVRQKVLNLMHSWTIDYPREIKIKDAFEMLKKQGVVKETPPPPPAPEEPAPPVTRVRTKDAIFEDEERSRMLQKLLQSKNPDDIQAANRLIKTMVREDERRVEAVSRRISELQTVHNNARLLDEMLDQYQPGVSSPEDLDLIKELHAACSRLRPTVFKLAAETQQNEEMLNLSKGTTGPQNLGKFWFLAKQFDEVLEASDELGQVFDKYSAIILHEQSLENSSRSRSQPGSILLNGDGNSLLDLATPVNLGFSATEAVSAAGESSHSSLEDLRDIFSSVDLSKNMHNANNVSNAPVLKPVSLVSLPPEKEDKQKQQSGSQNVNKGLAELDALGEGLLKKSLPHSSRVGVQFNNKQTDKVPMNLLKIASQSSANNAIFDEMTDLSPTEKNNQNNHNNLLDLDFLISKTLHSEGKANSQSSTGDDVMVDISPDDGLLESKYTSPPDDSAITLMEYLEDLKIEQDKTLAESMYKEKEVKSSEHKHVIQKEELKPINIPSSPTDKTTELIKSPVRVSDVKPLTDINISLTSIVPGDSPPATVFEEPHGITVVLHFAKNKPRPDVSVIVVSTTSRNTEPIEDFKFHAVVPKGCKVRLLPPSGDKFPAFSPFLPPAAITQVMLIAQPCQEPPLQVFLKFVITYMCQDDSISEMGEVNNLPLDV